MRLIICLITYNRLNYTIRTLKNLGDTINVPYQLVIVDNASDDGTKDWLKARRYKHILNDNNEYPGRACNQGWARGIELMPDASHLMRCDNDMDFMTKWATRANEYFEAMPPLGQLGLDHSALKDYNGDKRYLTSINGKTINSWPGNIGGPCIIRREVYDRGARYDETPWMDVREHPTAMITPQEDVKFSLQMHNYGFIYGHPTEKLAWTFADETNRSDYPSYYEKTFRERGYSL